MPSQSSQNTQATILSPATSLYLSRTFCVTSYPAHPWQAVAPSLVTYRARVGSIFSHPASVGLVGPRGKETWCRWGWSTRRSSATLILVPSSWTYTEGTNQAWHQYIRGNICHLPQAGSSNHLQEEMVTFDRSRGTRVDINTITRILTSQHQNSNVEMVRASKNALNQDSSVNSFFD